MDTIVTAAGDSTFPSQKLDSLDYADEITNRFFFSTNYDFNLLTHHTLTMSASIATKKDNTFYKRDQDNVNISATLTTFYKIPLQTTVAIIVSHNAIYNAVHDTITNQYLSTTIKQAFDYQTFSFNARYRILNDRLNLIATLAPSFGDFKRFLVQAGFDYQVMNNQYLVGQIDYIQNQGNGNDVIASIIYRFTF